MASSENKPNNKMDPFNFAEMLKNFTNAKPVDMNRDKILQQHRKNLEAIANANTMAADILKSISQLQTQFIKNAFDEMANFMRDCTQNMNPGNAEKQSKTVNDQVAQWVEHSNKIANMLSQSNRQIYDVFNNRFQESVDDLKETPGQSGNKKKAAH